MQQKFWSGQRCIYLKSIRREDVPKLRTLRCQFYDHLFIFWSSTINLLINQLYLLNEAGNASTFASRRIIIILLSGLLLEHLSLLVSISCDAHKDIHHLWRFWNIYFQVPTLQRYHLQLQYLAVFWTSIQNRFIDIYR